MKIRDNIADYIVTFNGIDLLLPDPIDWKEGEVSRTASQSYKGLDIKALCSIATEGQDVDVSAMTYNDVYKICETVLQMEEAGQQVFPR